MDDPNAGMALLLVLVAIYFLPTIVAMSRRHHQVGAIVVINLFLGWTLIGWVVALAWSVSSLRERIRVSG